MNDIPVKRASSTRLDEAAQQYYAPLLVFFRKRTRNSQDAKDLAQQVFLRLSNHPLLEDVDNIEAYLFQTASNIWKDHVRRSTVRHAFGTDRVESLTEETEGLDTDSSPERVLLGEEAIGVLIFALRELPERTRDIFILRCIDGLKHAEVARLMGISVRAVEKHASKAIAHIICALE